MLPTLIVLCAVVGAAPDVASAEARAKAGEWDELLVEWTRLDPASLPQEQRASAGAVLLAGCHQFAGTDPVMTYAFGERAVAFAPVPEALLCLYRGATETQQGQAAEDALRLAVKTHPGESRFALLLATELAATEPAESSELLARIPQGSPLRAQADALLARIEANRQEQQSARQAALLIERDLAKRQLAAAESSGTTRIVPITAGRGADRFRNKPVTVPTRDVLARLDAARGSPTLAFFYTSWCPSCKRDVPKLNDLVVKWAPRGVKAVGVSVDDNQVNFRRYLKDWYPRFEPLHCYEDNLAGELQRRGIKFKNSIPYVAVLDASGAPVLQGHLYIEDVDKRLEALLSADAAPAHGAR